MQISRSTLLHEHGDHYISDSHSPCTMLIIPHRINWPAAEVGQSCWGYILRCLRGVCVARGKKTEYKVQFRVQPSPDETSSCLTLVPIIDELTTEATRVYRIRTASMATSRVAVLLLLLNLSSLHSGSVEETDRISGFTPLLDHFYIPSNNYSIYFVYPPTSKLIEPLIELTPQH